MKQLELWPGQNLSTRPLPEDVNDTAPPEFPFAPFDELSLAAFSETGDSKPIPSSEKLFGVPTATPLPSAVEAGVFGMTLDGPIMPDVEQVEGVTAEHANEMTILLADSQVLEEAIRFEYDPATGRTPSTPEAKQSLLAKLDMEWKRLLQAYDDAVGAYAEGFGDAAAQTLDQWIRKTLAVYEQF